VQKFHVEIFSVKELNDEAVKEPYQVKISNRFAVLEKLNDDDDDVDITRA